MRVLVARVSARGFTLAQWSGALAWDPASAQDGLCRLAANWILALFHEHRSLAGDGPAADLAPARGRLIGFALIVSHSLITLHDAPDSNDEHTDDKEPKAEAGAGIQPNRPFGLLVIHSSRRQKDITTTCGDHGDGL